MLKFVATHIAIGVAGLWRYCAEPNCIIGGKLGWLWANDGRRRRLVGSGCIASIGRVWPVGLTKLVAADERGTQLAWRWLLTWPLQRLRRHVAALAERCRQAVKPARAAVVRTPMFMVSAAYQAY